MHAAFAALVPSTAAQSAWQLLTIVAVVGAAAVIAWFGWSARGHLTLDHGLVILIALVYTNASDLLSRAFGIPSLLQPLIGILAISVWVARKRLEPTRAIERPLTLLVILYATVIFSSGLWARDVSLANVRTAEAVRGVAFYLLVASLATSWESLRRGAAAIVVAAVVLGSLSAFQLVTGNLSNDFFGFAAVEEGNIYSDVAGARIAGPVHDPNFYGQMLLIALALAVGLALSTGTTARRIAFAAAALLTVTITIFTYSRGAMLVLAVLTLAMLLMLRVRLLHIASAGVAGLLVLAILPSAVTERLGTVELLLPGHAPDPVAHDASLDKRRLVLGAALEMFAAHPWLGVGAGNFTTNYTEYSNRYGSAAQLYDPPGSEQYPHTLYAQIAAETGVAGLTFFAASVITAFGSLIRSRAVLAADGMRGPELFAIAVTIALAAYLLTSLFLHGAYQRHLWILLGFTAAIARLRDETPQLEEATA